MHSLLINQWIRGGGWNLAGCNFSLAHYTLWSNVSNGVKSDPTDSNFNGVYSFPLNDHLCRPRPFIQKNNNSTREWKDLNTVLKFEKFLDKVESIWPCRRKQIHVEVSDILHEVKQCESDEASGKLSSSFFKVHITCFEYLCPPDWVLLAMTMLVYYFTKYGHVYGQTARGCKVTFALCCVWPNECGVVWCGVVDCGTVGPIACVSKANATHATVAALGPGYHRQHIWDSRVSVRLERLMQDHTHTGFRLGWGFSLNQFNWISFCLVTKNTHQIVIKQKRIANYHWINLLYNRSLHKGLVQFTSAKGMQIVWYQGAFSSVN